MNRSQESLFQTLFNYLTEPRIVVKTDSPRFTIVACNEQYKIVSNTVGKDLVGKGIKEIYQSDSAISNEDILIRDALNKAAINNEIVRLAAVRYDIPGTDSNTKEQSWWQTEYVPVPGENGKAEYLMCTIHNITDEVLSKEAIEKADKAEEELQKEKALTEELKVANEQLHFTQERLAKLVDELEERIATRTKELVESESYFRNMVLQAPVAIGLLTGRELVVETINDKLLEIWDKSRESVIGKPVRIALPEMEGQPYPQILDEVFTSGKAFHASEAPVSMYRNKLLTSGYYNFINHPLKDIHGNTVSILVVAIEVTEQVQARLQQQEWNEELAAVNEEITSTNQELAVTNKELAAAKEELQELLNKVQHAEEMLRISIEAANVGTWFIDSNQQEFKVSPRFKELFGYYPDEEMSVEIALAQINPEYREIVVTAMEKALVDGGTYNVEHPIIGYHDQKLRWVRALGEASQGSNGNFSGVLIEITEQKLDEIRKNDFIAMVSHELKTPLTTLKAYTQLVIAKGEIAKDAFSLEALDKVNTQINKMTAMVNSFLSVARLETGKIHLDKESCQLDKIIEQAVKEVSLVTQTASIHFLPCEPLKLYADCGKIEQVINNLLTNAIKYSQKNKPIEIKCWREEKMAWVSVKDEGVGIYQQDTGRLFERFYRVENKLNRTVSGFGIGLYLCAEIIKRHDGTLSVESEPGKGSTFYFSVPLA